MDAPQRVFALSLCWLLVALGSVIVAAGEEAEINLLRRITTVEDGVEIEVTSTRPFPVRALPPVLRIGEREFLQSRYPEDGRLDTLIFKVPAEEFEAMGAEDEVSVYYGHPAAVKAQKSGRVAPPAKPAGPAWSFGTLRKELLDQAPETPAE